MCNSGHAVGRLRRQSNVTSTRIVLADYLGRPRMLLTVRVPPACDVNGVFAAMHSLGRSTVFPSIMTRNQNAKSNVVLLTSCRTN